MVNKLQKETIALEEVLRRKKWGLVPHCFSAAYELGSIATARPDLIREETISALENLLKTKGLHFSLYKGAATSLCLIAQNVKDSLFEKAISVLEALLFTSDGFNPLTYRIVADELGDLPVSICGPEITEEKIGFIPDVDLEDVLKDANIEKLKGLRFIGRSLTGSITGNDKILVTKFACKKEPLRFLYHEIAWMEHLSGYSFPVCFDVPRAIRVKGSYVFRLKSIPIEAPENIDNRYAVSFIAHKDYFTYPNDYRPEKRLSIEEFKEVIFRNAYLLGNLTSLGIVHSSIIKLFHNITQAGRRGDQGIYDWCRLREGRLHSWLYMCDYPNIGKTGLRDFQHLISFNGPTRELYRHIGNQILSLLLIVGSYFRNKDRRLIGFDKSGRPIDARHLFDKKVLKGLIKGIFLKYYQGFTGVQSTGPLPFDLEKLSLRMIEEMGIDRYMEEILRVEDQNRMTHQEFKRFLKDNGYPEDRIERLKKGARDIIVYTGPHLGGFNQRVSLPELMGAIRKMSALCILARYKKERSSSFSLKYLR